MKRAIYLSQANKRFTDEDIAKLASSAAANNREYGITGYLCFSGNKIFQYIEGSPIAVDRLMITIGNDARHTLLSYLETDDHEERLFSSWDMHHLTESNLSEISLNDYVEKNLFYLKDPLVDRERCIRALWNNIHLISMYHDTKQLINPNHFIGKL